MRFAALGRTEFLYDTIVALHAAGHEPACIVTAPAAPEYARREHDFEQLAKDLGCPFLLVSNLGETDVAELLAGIDVAVSVNWPFILTQDILGLFPHGVLNIHAGDLPRYRGNACPNWAMLMGEKEVFLSVHVMQPGELDCGPILAQRSFPLLDTTYYGDILSWIQAVSPEMFRQALDSLDRDPGHSLKIARADAAEAFRCYPRVPEDGYIDWRQSALQIHTLIRASGPPLPGAYTYRWYKGRLEKVVVLRACLPRETLSLDLAMPGQVLRNDPESGLSFVACGDKSVLALEQCRIGEEPPFAPGGAWRSFRVRLGIRAEDMLWLTLREQGLAR